MKIYTIIVTYNAMQRNWINRCMESLSKSTVKTTPIIIDNGSTFTRGLFAWPFTGHYTTIAIMIVLFCSFLFKYAFKT